MATAIATSLVDSHFEETDGVTVYDDFDLMGLPTNVLRGIYAYGFSTPSAIQARAIVPMMKGAEVIAQAQSGTGKTGTFTIGALTHVDNTSRDTQVLILSHTKELAEQSTAVVKAIATYMNINVYCATGGRDVKEDISILRSTQGVQVLLGTPGRILDLVERGHVRAETIKLVILDEADNLLDIKFRKQIMDILKGGFTRDVKICLFTATLTSETVDFAKLIIKDPVKILVKKDNLTLDGISQYYVSFDENSDEHKFAALLDIYKCMPITNVIIFVNTKEKARWLSDYLGRNQITSNYIHGDPMPDAERRKAMSEFKSGKIRILVSTDLCARGIDVQQIGLVFNFEIPRDREDYLHRIGRSGRYGRKGVAINLINKQEVDLLLNIQQTYGTKIDELPFDLNTVSSTIIGGGGSGEQTGTTE